MLGHVNAIKLHLVGVDRNAFGLWLRLGSGLAGRVGDRLVAVGLSRGVALLGLSGLDGLRLTLLVGDRDGSRLFLDGFIVVLIVTGGGGFLFLLGGTGACGFIDVRGLLRHASGGHERQQKDHQGVIYE